MSLVEGRLWSKLLMLPRPTVYEARPYIWTCLQAALASELAWSLPQFAVSNGSKIPLYDFFSALAEGMSLRYDVILAKKIGVNGFKWIKSVFCLSDP